jgi:CHAT domain-containing protein
MRKRLYSIFLLLFLLASPSVGNTAERQAGSQGGAANPFSALEAMGQEAEKNNNWEGAHFVYRRASAEARTSGRYQQAISFASKALETAEKAKKPDLRARAILLMALAYSRVGQVAKAMELLERGVEVLKQVPSGNTKMGLEGSIYTELGINVLRTGDIQKAIEYLRHALQVQDLLLSIYLRAKSLPEMARVGGAQEGMVSTLERLGIAYRRAGNNEEAMKVLQSALSMIKGSMLNTPQTEARIYQGLGELYRGQKDFTRALDNFQSALGLAEKLEYADAIQRVSSQIGDLLRQTQKGPEAIPYYKKSIESIESTRSLLESEEFRTSFFEDKGQIYGGIILAHLGAKNVDEAFNYNERARSRAFLDILGSKVQLTTHGALVEEERALQAKISLLKARVGARGEEGGEGRGGQSSQELESAQKAYNDFLAKVRKENKEQASLMNVEPLTLKQVQELLEPGVTMLEYFVMPQTVLLWVVEKDRSELVQTPIDRKDLVSKVGSFRQGVFQLEEIEKVRASAQELYRLLIEPAVPHIHGKELIIVPHDSLHYVPFHALLSPEGRYLVESYPVYYLSSASLMQFTKAKSRGRGEKVLAFGNPDLDDPAMNLKFAELEAKQIQALYPESTVVLKKDATEAKAKALAPQNDIIHFATHAQLSEDDPLSSAILLAKEGKEDGRLEVREIFGMDLKANLVVLSACETGLGKLSSGDELVGLTRAFIYAGTPSVVASLWNVEDSSTAALMASFYKNLKTMSKVESLRQAQLALIRGEARSDLLARRGIGGVGKLGEVPAPNSQSPTPNSISTSHPYFWAPFILVGDGK